MWILVKKILFITYVRFLCKFNVNNMLCNS